MMKALNDLHLCDEASALETSYYIALHNEILIQRSLSAFVAPNRLLCKLPYFCINRSWSESYVLAALSSNRWVSADLRKGVAEVSTGAEGESVGACCAQLARI